METLWEEKNLIEQKRNLPNSLITVPSVIINETKNTSVRNVCEDIGNKKIWKRNCPKCGNVRFYSYKSTWQHSENTLCRSCSQTIHFDKHYTKNCPKCGNVQVYSCYKSYSLALKNNYQCKTCHGIVNGKLGINSKRSDETKRKMRISFINRMKKRFGNFPIRSNPNACKFIDEIGNKLGYNFQHAANIGEYHIKHLGYFVDGYDKDKNVVIEYDEPKHYYKNGKLRNKDIVRMTEIKNHLNCKFIRYNEITKQIVYY